jgi:hypothetical protein
MAHTTTEATANGNPAAALLQKLDKFRQEYDHGHGQPVGGYAAVLAAFAAAAGAAAGIGTLTGRTLPRRFAIADLMLGGVAVHKCARILAKDAVTSPLRVPFTKFEGAAGSSEVKEEVRGQGLRHAVGELISCPFCLAPWVGAAYVGGLVVAPRVTRTLSAWFAVVAVSDVTQQAYGALKGLTEKASS